MVQKSKKPPVTKIDDPVAPKRRGRPRAYEPDVALGKALDLFRKDGFAATSLDDLSAATGMNRPSLYGAFGDKRELFIKSYRRYREDARIAMGNVFRDELPIRKRLERIYAVALDIYLSGESGPRGCFTVMTAASEAVHDPDIRAMVLEGFVELDKAFAACFRMRQGEGRATGERRRDRAGAARLRHHSHHRDPSPCQDAAQGAGGDCERSARCDARDGEVISLSSLRTQGPIPRDFSMARGRQTLCHYRCRLLKRSCRAACPSYRPRGMGPCFRREDDLFVARVGFPSPRSSS